MRMADIVAKVNAFSADRAFRHNRTSFVFTLRLEPQQREYSKEPLKKQALFSHFFSKKRLFFFSY